MFKEDEPSEEPRIKWVKQKESQESVASRELKELIVKNGVINM